MIKLTATERTTLEKLFNKMDGEDLNLVTRLYSARNRAVSAVEAARFHVGEKVSFKANFRVLEGVVTKINVKTVKVLVGDSLRYSVSPSLLSKV